MTEAVEIGAVTASTARALLRLRGDTASRALAELLVRRYGSLTEDQKIEFFRVLLDEFGADRAAVDAAIGNYQADPTEQTLVTLAEAADSRRLELFRAINTAPGGIAVLLDMRTVLLAQGSDVPELEPVEKDLKHLLGSWFNRGFLRLEQLTWETSAHILESLIKYEAVMRFVDELICVADWRLIVVRLASSTRRCLTSRLSLLRLRLPRDWQRLFKM